MYLKGIFIILAFLALGMLCSYGIGQFIPGSVLGMVLLFLALKLRIVKADDVRPVADFLTKNMTLFFLPASIGIMEQWGIIKMNFVAWSPYVWFRTDDRCCRACFQFDSGMTYKTSEVRN